MVHGNAVFITEEAKQARNTHQYNFQSETSLLSTPLTSLSMKQTTSLAKKIISSCDYDVKLGKGLFKKVWYLRGAESFVFSQKLAPPPQKKGTMDGPRSMF